MLGSTPRVRADLGRAPVRGVYYARTSRRDGSPDRQRGVRVRGPKEPSAARFGGSFVLPGAQPPEPRAGLRSALPVLLEQRELHLVVARRQAAVGQRLRAAGPVLARLCGEEAAQEALAAEAQLLGEGLGRGVARVREDLEPLHADLLEGPAHEEARRRQGYAPAARLALHPVADLGGLPVPEQVQANTPEQLAGVRIGDR